MVITDDTYRSALVDWELSGKKIKQMVLPELEQGRMVITQGFIGGHGKHSTTLGREGSDFSAAIFAHVLDADAVVVWKDVPGYLNADPRYFENTVKLDKLSFNESVELAFYGAKIIHPKTIRPLKAKNIPLWVKSFIDPAEPGSLIHNDLSSDALVPSCIIKEDQVLISISTRDFSFIAEDHLHRIFGLMAAGRTAINLMQNSAISFSVCVDNNPRLPALLSELQHEFRLRYNHGLQLITIRHYDQPTIEKLTKGKEILLEQRSRLTVQMVVKQT
jgi:aspartate kinase